MKKKIWIVMIGTLQLFLILVVGLWVFHQEGRSLLTGSDLNRFEQISLKKGSYEIRLKYRSSSNDNVMTFTSESDPWAVQADEMRLYYWKTENYLDIRVIRDIQDGKIVYDFPGECEFEIIEFTKTSAYLRRIWIEIIALLVVADLGFVWYLQICRKSKDKKGILIRTILLLVTVIISHLYIGKYYFNFGPDIAFHLTRIQGIADGLTQGQFPVRINTYWLDGAGVAVPVFYGDFLLYFPAMLYKCGFTLQEAIKIYVFAISLLTAILSYLAFRLYYQRPWIALTCSVFYVLSLYRIMNLLNRGAIGEYSAMSFLPVALCGLLVVLENDERRIKGMLMLAIGTACTLATHNITTLLLLVDLLMIFLIKLVLEPGKLFKRQVFGCLLQGAIIAALLSAFFWVPMFTYLKTGDMGASNSILSGNIGDDSFSKHAIGLDGLLAFGSRMTGEEILGLMVVAVAVLYFVVWVSNVLKYSQSPQKYSKTGATILIIWIIQLFLSSKQAPWDLLTENTKILNKWIAVLQFPFRYSSVETILGTLLLGLLMASLYEIPTTQKRKLACFTGSFLIIVLCGVNAVGFQKKLDDTGTHYKFYGHNAFSLYWGWGLEYSFELPDTFYLPSETQKTYYMGAFANLDKYNPGVEFEGDIERLGVTTELFCKNRFEYPQVILFPYVMYPGYRAFDKATGAEFSVTKGPAAMVQVEIPGRYEGELKVTFMEPVSWRLAECTSLITLIGLGCYELRRWMKQVSIV